MQNACSVLLPSGAPVSHGNAIHSRTPAQLGGIRQQTANASQFPQKACFEFALATAAHPLGDQIFSHCFPDLQQQLIMWVLTHGTVPACERDFSDPSLPGTERECKARRDNSVVNESAEPSRVTRFKSIQGDRSWLTMALQCFAEECLCRSHIAPPAQVGFHRPATFIDHAVEPVEGYPECRKSPD